MTTLSINNLNEGLLAKLHSQAIVHGISMEEEVHHILAQAVNQPKLGDMAVALFGENNGIELDLEEKFPHQPLDLSE
ncbi:MAG: hypothetical protein GQ569_09200 [Methylococcaceae bacterium]|nr:hypothetical protein [Methylococcaceae bacterium]